MTIQTNFSNNIDQNFKNQLSSNFKSIDQSLKQLEKLSSGDVAPTRDEMLKAIQGVRGLIYTIVVGSDKGDSSIEIIAARRSMTGKEYDTLNERLDRFEAALIRLGVDPNE